MIKPADSGRLQPIRSDQLLLALLAAAVLALLLLATLDPRWGYDEGWHLYLSSVTPWNKALEEGLVDAHPPLHHLLLAPIAAIASSPFWLRLPSVIAAVMTLLLWHGVLRRLTLAPQPALSGTFLLATSFALLELGATTRGYSLGMLCLMLGLFGAVGLWRETMPGGASANRATLDTKSLFVAALGFTLAFAFMYAALLVALALIVAWLLTAAAHRWRERSAGHSDLANWRERQRSIWLALGVFLVGHAAILLWFIAGYGRARGASAPQHMESFLLADGGSIVDFAWLGLQANAAWITPQLTALPFGAAIMTVLFWCLAILMLVQSWRARQTRRVTLILALFLLTALLLLAGILGVYPFGGLIRHQSVLLPLSLLVIAFAIDWLWAQLVSRRGRQSLAAAVVAFGVLGLGQAWYADDIGEGDDQMTWSAGLIEAIRASDDGMPLYLSGAAFYPAYAALYPQGIAFRASLAERDGGLSEVPYGRGWIASLGWGRDWDLYEVGDAPLRILRDRRRWLLPAVPDERFWRQLSAIMSHFEFDSLRLLKTVPVDAAPFNPAVWTNQQATADLKVNAIQRQQGIETWLVTRPDD